MQTQPQLAAPPPSAWSTTAIAKVTFGSLVGRSFSVWRRNLARFAGVTAVLHLPSFVLTWVVAPSFAGASASPFSAPPAEMAAYLFTPAWWALALLGGAATLVHVGALTAGAVQHLAGKDAGIAEMLAAGLRRALPVLAAGVLVVLAFYAGLVLLVVPGVIFGLMYSLAIPVVMAEPLGPVKSLGRSRALTKGHRWALLGTYLLAYAVALTAGVGAGLLLPEVPALRSGVTFALNALVGPILYVVPAVAYHDLRVAKDGVVTSELARVFE